MTHSDSSAVPLAHGSLNWPTEIASLASLSSTESLRRVSGSPHQVHASLGRWGAHEASKVGIVVELTRVAAKRPDALRGCLCENAQPQCYLGTWAR